MRRFINVKSMAILLLLLAALLCASCNIVQTKPPVEKGTTETTGEDDTTAPTKTTEPTVTTTPTVTTELEKTVTVKPTVTPTPTVTTTTAPTQTEPEPTVEMLPAQEVKVIGINVLCNADSVDQRAPGMLELLKPYEADSIGVQECMGKWEQYLEQGLGDKYARVGVDCLGNQNAKSFATYIYYLKDKYIPIDTGTFWMSKTPDVPSQYGSTVDMNRTCTWVILENIETGFRYVHMNLHLDHKDRDVNKIQCQMILQQILRFEEMGYPVFSTGDYNTGERWIVSSYPILTSEPDHVADARYEAENSTDMITHPGNEDNIDYCFVTKQYMDVKQFSIVDTHATGTQLSDHKGTFTHALVKSLPKQDHTKAIPEFEDDAKLTVSDCLGSMLAIQFPQAFDESGSVARFYRVEILDTNGFVLASETVSSGYHTPNAPEAISYSKSFSNGYNAYLVRITPLSLFGQRGEALIQWAIPKVVVVEPEAPTSAPDLLDLGVVGDTVVDQTENGYEMKTVGTMNINGKAFNFTNNGNIQIASFFAHKDKLKDGFAMAVSFRTGSDVVSQQTVVGNMHAGGYGIQVNNSRVSFSVHLNGSYVSVSAPAYANTDYHVIGVFDPESGLVFYVNGELVDKKIIENGEMSFATKPKAQYLCIGADSNEGDTGEIFFKGSIYEVKIYSAPLTAGNALYLYQNR